MGADVQERYRGMRPAGHHLSYGGDIVAAWPKRAVKLDRKVLDADTPENRYMKHILSQTHVALKGVIDRIDPVERISPVFKRRLREWSADWARIRQHRFWRGIGSFHGLRKESLVLSQDPLYAGVRRSWYLLQQGLELLDQDLRGGIQNAAQLYEIWCLTKIVQLIEHEKWRCPQEPEVGPERADDDFDAEEISSGTVKFEYRKPGLEMVRLDLLFKPTAGRAPERDGVWAGMIAVPVKQCPDIVLRLHRDDLPNRPVYTWIFDAKYRLNGNSAPDDAVNQMHRYRDAILWSGQTGGTVPANLTRESIGAYVLYPGDETDGRPFPQVESVDETNIGAFPLRPTEKGALPIALSQKLTSLLRIKTDYRGIMEQQHKVFASVPSVKQKATGIIAVSAVRGGMNADYWSECRLYRMPVGQAERRGMSPETWEYIAPQRAGERHYGVFPVLSRQVLPRQAIEGIYDERGVPIRPKPKADQTEYWLFELGDPVPIPEDLYDLKAGTIVQLDRF